jgi:hypothetical protein
MFDKLYVLAKGGICVFSGPPKNLGSHLSECGILCDEFQFPIEVMLKIATYSKNDDQVIELANKTLEEKVILLNRCKNETHLFPNGIPFKSKYFKLRDFWNLLLRTMTNTYISQWKSLITQLLFYIVFALITTKLFNSEMGKPDGCFSFLFNSNTSCYKQLDDDSLLDQNAKYYLFTSQLVMFIQLLVSVLTFSIDVKIFLNEHRNSKS